MDVFINVKQGAPDIGVERHVLGWRSEWRIVVKSEPI